MHAAVVTSFDRPPRYQRVPEPTGPLVVEVLASGLHPLVRARASGQHYSVAGAGLPMVPGADGVGRLADGRLVYFTVFDTGGAMAERVAVDPARCVPLPDCLDDPTALAIAAGVNPAMAGWLALRGRALLRAGERVLVLGATGAAGRAAVLLARELGAGAVIAAGRNPEMLAGLAALGADQVVSLVPESSAEELAAVAGEVDVVVDFLWGAQTERALPAILAARPDPARPLRWVEVGGSAGTRVALPGALLRGWALELTGSGLGSIPPERMITELTELVSRLVVLPPTVSPEAVRLREVETVWTAEPAPGSRIVFVP